MKKLIAAIFFLVVIAGVLIYRSTIRERELVILSTNDIHATTDSFPELVTAINQCRDTVTTLLVDAGDRWSGNAFIDRSEGRLPIIDLMNHAGYDVATLGNHEFDKGSAVLQGAISHASFPILCANMVSNRDDIQTLSPSVTITPINGIRVCFVGVVTNYDNGHPDGINSNFENLEFCNPMLAADKAVAECPDADIKILLSHMGDDKDMEFAAGNDAFDIIIGGHTHAVLDTLVNKTVIGQTGRYLAHIGATHIRMKGRKITSIEYRNIPLSNYTEDTNTRALIDQIESDPVLGAPVGNLSEDITHTGFENLVSTVIAKATYSDIGFYHYGGLRIPLHPAGTIKLATVYNLEPFDTKIHTITMTRDQIRHMILTKFNDTLNPKESHRIELYSTTPYTVIVDNRGEAIDVLLPTLAPNTKYRVALPSYVGQKHPNLKGDNHTEHDMLVVDEILKELSKHQSTSVDNKFYQKISKQ